MDQPQVVIDPDALRVLSESEIRNTLLFLAHKTGKSVHFQRYRENFMPSESRVVVEVAPSSEAKEQDPFHLKGMEYPLESGQGFTDLSLEGAADIFDDDGGLLALAQYNRIVILVDITAADNPAAWAILAHIVEKTPEKLNFDVKEVFERIRGEFARKILEYYRSLVSGRLQVRKEELIALDRQIEESKYTIQDAEGKKPLVSAEIEGLERLHRNPHPTVVVSQTRGLGNLLEQGLYESIEVASDGALSAVTEPIEIEYDGDSFPMGRYSVKIALDGQLKIKSVRGHDRTQYPHPHVSTAGSPCWGNIGADIAKLLGALRFADVLQVTHRFLCAYNSGNPYEKIGHFDPTGEYQDEDEDDDPCQDCDDRSTPYCIRECAHGGSDSCPDCVDYRTDFCYESCRYNEEWQLVEPCDDCPFSACDEKCPYFTKKEELDHVSG